MTRSVRTECTRRSFFRKLPFLVLIFGFLFLVGSTNAQDAEGLDGTEEKEETTNDESNGEEKTTSDSSDINKQSATTASSDEEADAKKDEAVVTKGKKESKPKVAKKDVKKKNPETGSHLPNGDPTINLIRLTGDAARDFYWRHEYLRW